MFLEFNTIIKRASVILLASAITASVIVACGGGGSSSTSASSDTNYTGPGSKWDATLAADGTFTVQHRNSISDPVDVTVTGTYTRQSNGLVVLTVSQAVDAANNVLSSPTAGDKAWAIDAPGYALMLRPMDSNNDQLIPMVTAGACPTSDLNANWVIVNADDGADASNPTRDWFGTFAYTAATGAANIPSKYSLANMASNLGENAIGSGTCTDGIMTVGSGADQAVMYLATNGAIVRTGTSTANDDADDNFIFALTQKAISNIANLDGTYGGILFDDNNATGEKIVPVSMTCTSGVCTAVQIDSTDLSTTLPGTATIDLTAGSGVDQPGDGFVTGTVSDGSFSGNLSCMVDIDAAGSGRKIASCVGQSPVENTKLFNVMFVSN